jgi:hypothetical protein
MLFLVDYVKRMVDFDVNLGRVVQLLGLEGANLLFGPVKLLGHANFPQAINDRLAGF